MGYQEAGLGQGSRARDRGDPMFDGELRYGAWILYRYGECLGVFIR